MYGGRGDWAALCALAALSWVSEAGPRCPPASGARCEPLGHGHDEYTFSVDGARLYVKFAEGDYLSLQCGDNVTLEHPALPSFEREVRVRRVVLRGCALPVRAYAAVLGALRVRVLHKLELEGAASQNELTPAHLAGLDVAALALVRVRLAPAVWRAVPELRQLRLEETRPPQLEELPVALTDLHLVAAGVTALERATLARLTALTTLTVRDEAVELRVEPTVPLRELALQARAVHLGPALPPTLAHLTVWRWVERAPAPWRSCDALGTLDLESDTVETLPAGWVSACPALRELSLRGVTSLHTVSPDALRGARALSSLTLSDSALQELPGALLDDALNLTVLTLTNNKLRALHTASLWRVRDLYLYNNSLEGGAWDALSALPDLRVLHLSHNRALGDACAGGVNAVRGTSKIVNLRKLRKLYLRNTNVSVICRDWREQMPRLTELDLRDNRIPFLTYRDMQFPGGGAGAQGASSVRVLLAGNPLRALLYTREEAAACGERSRARVLLAGSLRCDCDVVWAARALRACPGHVRVEGARCEDGGDLTAAPLTALTCPLSATQCGAPANCSCSYREAERERGLVWRVSCQHRTAPPRLKPSHAHAHTHLSTTHVAYELSLPHNRLDRLSAADLPTPLLELDVRYNNITFVPEEIVEMLPKGARLLLEGNPLSCACDAAPHVRALLRRADLVTDGPRCAGAPLAVPRHCAPPAPRSGPQLAPAPLLALLAPLGAIVALVTVSVAHPRARRRLKELVRSALCPARRVGAAEVEVEAEVEDEEAALPYDVFLSFSHEDEARAARLLAWLEARRYRVCVHWRDWAPGGWIPAQIAASVRRSRRTLLLVSQHFVRSPWARAEFRAAHALSLRGPAHASRLIVVLLEEPARLPLDAELREYLSSTTYALWGERCFWTKLGAALPPPTPPPPPPGPPPDAAPPPPPPPAA